MRIDEHCSCACNESVIERRITLQHDALIRQQTRQRGAPATAGLNFPPFRYTGGETCVGLNRAPRAVGVQIS
jgi:hypothetical protein